MVNASSLCSLTVGEAHLPAPGWHVCHIPYPTEAHMVLQPGQVFDGMPTYGSAHVLSEPRSLTIIALPAFLQGRRFCRAVLKRLPPLLTT